MVIVRNTEYGTNLCDENRLKATNKYFERDDAVSANESQPEESTQQ